MWIILHKFSVKKILQCWVQVLRVFCVEYVYIFKVMNVFYSLNVLTKIENVYWCSVCWEWIPMLEMLFIYLIAFYSFSFNT